MKYNIIMNLNLNLVGNNIIKLKNNRCSDGKMKLQN